jgi:hypothetical protein
MIEMGVRWYDAQLGRWISADTIVPGLENPQSLCRFAYVYNNPLNYTDPSGHDPCDNPKSDECKEKRYNECLSQGLGPVECSAITRHNRDPVFGGPDFLSTYPIEPASGSSIYRLHGAPTAEELATTAEEFSVPPEVIAAILQYENNPEYGLIGLARRGCKIYANKVLQPLDPGHAGGSGYSQGLANCSVSEPMRHQSGVQ